MNALEAFLDLNGIDKNILMNALHLDIREIVLKSIIEKMKADEGFFIKVKQCYCTYDDLDAARKIVRAMCNFSMPDDDIKWFDKCFKAFMKKKNTRATIRPEVKKKLLADQNGKCAKCGAPITLSTMHTDHIIPWDYVGDELEDNFQGLCSDCNLHKSNHVAASVSSIILNGRT